MLLLLLSSRLQDINNRHHLFTKNRSRENFSTGKTDFVTYGPEIVSLTPGHVAIKWLLPGWMTVCGQVNHLGR